MQMNFSKIWMYTKLVHIYLQAAFLLVVVVVVGPHTAVKSTRLPPLLPVAPTLVLY